MATKSTKSRSSGTAKRSIKNQASSQVTKVASTQKEINRDYKVLFEDYKKLTKELWEIPGTKYIVGGLAAGSLIPMALGALRKFPKMNSYIEKGLDTVENQLDEIGEKFAEKIPDSLRKDTIDEDAKH